MSQLGLHIIPSMILIATSKERLFRLKTLIEQNDN
jgi:hypothetical protein